MTEHLEVLGQKAASRWADRQSPTLNAAVVDTIHDAALGPEEVRRVVEFANTTAYLSEFHKEGGRHKVVDFGDAGPADAEVILRHLNAGTPTAPPDGDLGDYALPPERSKVAGAEEALQGLFAGVGEATPYSEPYADVLALRDTIRGARDEIAADRLALERRVDDLAADLAHGIKEAARGGASLSDIVQAWEVVSPSDAHVTAAFQRALPHAADLFPTHESICASLDKVAEARLVNREHPLVQGFAAFADALTKLAQARVAEEELGAHLPELEAVLKEAAGLYGAAKQVAERASKPMGSAAEKVVGALVGSGNASRIAGKAAGGVVRHAPLLGTLAAANEVRRHVKYSPTLSAARGALLKHVPGTADYQMHNYEIQSGQ